MVEAGGAVPGAAAAQRTVRLLKELARGGGRPRRIAALAAATGIPQPTVARLLAALRAEGVVARARDTAGWTLGVEPAAWGAVAVPPAVLARADAALRGASEALGDAVGLWVAAGRDAVCLAAAEGTFPLDRPAPGVGDRVGLPADEDGPLAAALVPALVAARSGAGEGVAVVAVPVALDRLPSPAALAVVTTAARLPEARATRVRRLLAAHAAALADAGQMPEMPY